MIDLHSSNAYPLYLAPRFVINFQKLNQNFTRELMLYTECLWRDQDMLIRENVFCIFVEMPLSALFCVSKHFSNSIQHYFTTHRLPFLISHTVLPCCAQACFKVLVPLFLSCLTFFLSCYLRSANIFPDFWTVESSTLQHVDRRFQGLSNLSNQILINIHSFI